MLKILIVDDNQEKTKNILDAISEVPDIQRSSIETAADIITAKRQLISKVFDLLILDIQLPMRFGEVVRVDAGAQFLEELRSDTSLKKPFHVIGVTSHTELIFNHRELFENDLWTLILFEEQYFNWKSKLINKINYLVQSKRELLNPINSDYIYDLAIITALKDPELSAVLALNANWEEIKFENDSVNTYYKGVFQREGKRVSVVATACSQMGMTAAAVTSMKLIHMFRPKYLCMVGIAAGIRGKSEYGDILIAEQSWDYGNGKNRFDETTKRTVFEPDPKPIVIDPELLNKLSQVVVSQKYLSDIQRGWKYQKIASPLNAFIGPVASGSAVLENIQLIEDHIITQQRKTIGIEMEIYGVFFSARFCEIPKPKAFAIKSVCDFGDSEKNNNYQSYASYTSANFLYYFALDEL